MATNGDFGPGSPLLYPVAPAEGAKEGYRLGRSGGHLAGNFIVPQGAVALELAIAGPERHPPFGRIRLRRLTRSEYYLRLLAAALAAQRRRGTHLACLVRQALRLVATGGPGAVCAELRRIGHGSDFREDDYAAWIASSENLPARLPKLRARLEQLAAPPLISVLMPVRNTRPALLREAIGSVRNQCYGNWELCVVDDGSDKPAVREMLEAAAVERRVKLAFHAHGRGIAAATNSALALAQGQWIALLDHDDLLAPHALAEIALAAGARPQVQMIYSDEDKLSPAGQRIEPYFKPDFSPELFRSQNYLNHLVAFRADAVRAVGGWRSAFDGSQDYDLALRIFERSGAAGIHHIPQVLYHWRSAPASVARSGTAKPRAFAAGLDALRAHIARTGLDAVAEPAPNTPYYRLRPALPTDPPLVSLIVLTRDKPELLRRAIASIRRKTTYPNYEIIIVDNGSSAPEALRLLESYADLPKIRVCRDDRPFNFSALNNAAVAAARGSIVGLLNNDIEVISPDWLTEMVAWASQPDIGCVGAKLYYPDGRIQHAGIVLGLGGVAGHSHKYFPRQHPGYYHRLRLVQNVSAVTGACLLVRKQIYQAVGGLNETELAVAFNDVDFCLKVLAAGYRNVWTPYAEFYHLESASRGRDDSPDKVRRFDGEAAYIRGRWALSHDPCYSPHLTREREDFSIAITQPAEGALHG